MRVSCDAASQVQGRTTIKTLTGQGRRVAVALAALGLSVTIAACGSASPTTTGSGVSGQSDHTGVEAFARCMRSNGVPTFPDLGSSGIRIAASGQSLSVNGVPIDAPAFASARSKCEQYLPHVHLTQPQIAAQTRKGLSFARCMRGHGVPNFPDPKATTGTNGNGVVDLRGAGLNFASPAFKAAANACGGFAPKGPP